LEAFKRVTYSPAPWVTTASSWTAVTDALRTTVATPGIVTPVLFATFSGYFLPAIVNPTNSVLLLAVGSSVPLDSAVLVVSTAETLMAPFSRLTLAVRAWAVVLKPSPDLTAVASVLTAPTWARPPTRTDATLFVVDAGCLPMIDASAVRSEVTVVPTALIFVPPAEVTKA
jgi:hypothetical protein